jgi:FlaA1/EpsC-like NDP-sugar epimerase
MTQMRSRVKPYTLTILIDWLLVAGCYAGFQKITGIHPAYAGGAALLHLGLFTAAGVYRSNLKYLNLFVLRRMFLISAIVAATLQLTVSQDLNFRLMSAAALIVALNILTLSHRLIWYFRLNPESRVKKQGLLPVLIYGAGTVAHHLLQDLSAEDLLGRYQIAAIVDNDAEKIGAHVGPYRVLSGTQLRSLAERFGIRELWFTMPASPDFLRTVMDQLQGLAIAFKIIPRKLAQFAPDIRELRIEDLIRRPEIRLNEQPVIATIRGKRVLITGAAGSIGRELSQQIAGLNPARLTLIDQWEHGVYQLEAEFSQPNIFCAVADIRNQKRLEDIITAEKPEIIFHAAAYKHVPLMETNHLQAIDTNILGTWHLLCAIRKYAAGLGDGESIRIVNISTDKAVEPENIMGITKRIAELLMYNFAESSSGRVHSTSVRFGNVLGSSGSVVPKFWSQIQQGGPVTVTHPDMERFFMTIPEAVRLVLQAAALNEGTGSILALDMGKPVRIVELAERLIRLAGKKPGADIEISYTGIRPGEKMKEELFWQTNSVHTEIPFIFRSIADVKKMNLNEFIDLLMQALSESRSRTWYKEFLLRYV